MRMLTHKGAISPNALAVNSQHNSRLSFLGKPPETLDVPHLTLATGRRIIRLYLAVFFHAHKEMLSHSTPRIELNDETLEGLVDTYKLGQHIAARWQLEPHLHWRQMVSSTSSKRSS